jgi:cytochrome P450
LPLIGNLQDLPPPGVQEWIHWSKHRDLYGPISSVTVLGQTIVILNDSRAAIDLLERRSAIHSSRPRLVFAFEMCGWLNFLSSQPYGDRFRAYRKQVHGLLGTAQPLLERFGRLQEQEVGRCLLRVLQKPRDFVSHIRTEAGATILKIAYGYTIEPHGPEPDPLVSIADEALDQFSKATVPGRWMVDVLPSLRYLPDWFPGAGFKRTARHWDDTVRHVVEDPYRFVQEHPTEATANSFVGDCLRNEEKLDDEQKFVVKWTAASLYTGGADTTVSSLTIFCLAMTLYPEVQKKAQEEIDRVVGTDRLPTFGDRASLPYVEAVVKETMRWHPIGPMGVPHMSTEDDEYDGYLIPKGAILMPNVWLMTHDPETYHDPARFNPDRFLSDKSDGEATPEQDPNRYVFGFGRRICPGRVLADQSIYLTIAQMLAVFEFSKPDGAEIHPEFEAGIISHPRPFQTNIEVRDPQREKLIRDIEVKYPWEKSDAAYFKDLQRSQKA